MTFKNLLIVFLLISPSIHVTMGLMDYFNIETCSAGGDLSGEGDIPPRKAMVFSEITFNCDGRIGSWEYYVHRTNSVFYASVWRIDKTTGKYVYVGSNVIKPPSKGYHVYEVPANLRIRVKYGDMLGFMYPHSNRQKPMISVNSEGGSAFSSYSFGWKEIKAGHTVSPDNTLTGRPALRGVVLNTNPNLRLEGGNKRGVGRAEIKENGEIWGTICDRWFEVRGWPMAFCMEMGYPGVVNATYVKDQNAEYAANEDVPIHLHNPRCKVSDNKTVLNCAEHPRRDCGHDLDVFIECEPRVGLSDPFHYHKIKTGGIPIFFEGGIWMLVCDTRPPEWHENNRNVSWVTAVCRELGFTGFESLEKKNGIPRRTGLSIPTCLNEPSQPPNLLSQCPSDLQAGPCSEKSYEIKCETSELGSWAS